MKLAILKHKLIKQSAIYVTFDGLNKIVPFLMLPILTRYLSTEEYGIVAMFIVLVSFLAVFAGISVHGSVNVNYFRMQKDEFRKYISNVFIVLIFSTLITACALSFITDWIFAISNIPTIWIWISLLIAASQFITLINLVLWQAEQRAVFYGIYSFIQIVLNAGISIILVVQYEYGWIGRLSGISITTIIMACISIILIYKRGYIKFNLNSDHQREILHFGIPVIPHVLAGWATIAIDRLLLSIFLGVSATGIYTVGHQVGMMVSIIAASFSRAYTPHIYKKLETADLNEKRRIVKHTYYYFFIILLLALFLGVLAYNYLYLFVGLSFVDSSKVVPLVALGSAFTGMYFIVNTYIFYMKKTILLSYSTLIGSFVHVLLSYYLIQNMGIIGAALASAISGFLIFILTWLLSMRVYKMPWFK